jgi:hypothetical protein
MTADVLLIRQKWAISSLKPEQSNLFFKLMEGAVYA